MASSSTSSIQKIFKYDVFLSFRGDDTRRSFVDHLYYALQQKSIHTYKDDERIKKGKRIGDELIRSIEDSKFYIIVFSKKYASSSWCLDELVKIMECQKMTEYTAYPVFYDVEPTEVRNQSGSVGAAFAKHEKERTAGQWRVALKEASVLAGWELMKTADGHEVKLIRKIIEEISLELRFTDLSIDGKLMGMETRVKDVVSSLETGVDDVRMIGIKGMGGAGKTTLARAVFDQISILFEGSSFVERVREVSKDSFYGSKSLQKQVLSDVLNDQGISVSSVSDGKFKMKKMMCGRKVLVVLDDVDHMDQLEALAGEPNWFGPGSRIIITTRDEQLLVAQRVNFICDVNLLSQKEASCLFSRYAFGKDIPIEGYGELLAKFVRYAAGLPLTIRVLGSFLCGKDELEWKDALERLKVIPLKETLEKLELSYDGLEDDYKEIFLDVACILKGEKKDDVIRVLESCGFHARNGLRVLEQRSLITISDFGGLGMHDHIEEMGKNNVRRFHPNEPFRHSRLWIREEIEDILANGLGTEATRCIMLRHTKLDPYIVMKGLGNMKELRYLQVSGGSARYHANLEELKVPVISSKLKFLNLSRFKLRTLNLSQNLNLVTLHLEYCAHLVELHMPGESSKLKFLNIYDCKLKTLNLLVNLNLETLSLKYCSNLIELQMPVESPKLKSLNISDCKLRTLNLRQNLNLETLSLESCSDLVELHIPNDESSKLKCLSLYCCKLKTLNLAPLNLNLETLSLRCCSNLIVLQMPVQSSKLKSLNISDCKLRNLNLRHNLNLETLSLECCFDLVELHMPNNKSSKVKSLSVYRCKLKTLNLASLNPNLVTVSLKSCSSLIDLQMPVESSKLKSLNISDCKLRTLNLLRNLNLETLSVQYCSDLVELHMPNNKSSKLKSLYLYHCKLKTLNLASLNLNLETLCLKYCSNLIELQMPVGSSKLKSLNITDCKLRTLNLLWNLNLETLGLQYCSDLVELHMPNNKSSNLKSLKIFRCKLRTLNLAWNMNLEMLNLEHCDDLVELHMPSECSKLKFLNLSYCKLRTLNLTLNLTLETLSLGYCFNLGELHMPSKNSKLKSLDLYHSMLGTLDLALNLDLENLSLKYCANLIKLQMPVDCSKLKFLEFFDCKAFKNKREWLS